MANNPLDELVQTSSNLVADQPGLADVGDPSISPVPSSAAPDMPSQSAAVPSPTPPTTQANNPLDELISGTTGTPVPTNAPSNETPPLPSSLSPLDALVADKGVLATSAAATSPSVMSAAVQAQPNVASLDNPLDSLITHKLTDKQPEPDAGLQSSASQPDKEKPLNSPLDAFTQPGISSPPSVAATVTEKPLPQVDKPATLPGLPEHDIAAMPLSATQGNTPAAPAPAPSGIPSPEIKPAMMATIDADQASTLSKKELEEKAKKLLKDSPPESKSNKKPWILGLLTLLLVVGAAAGGLFAFKLINPKTTDQRSRAAGICCMGGECNDGTTFGGDPSAGHSSCDVRATEFCADKGGVKRDDGACSGSTPHTCNDQTPADLCWVFICPNGCGGDDDDTSCNGSEKDAVRRRVDCDDAKLGPRECGQIDYVKNEKYCGVMKTQCGTDCDPNPTTQPSPTAQPSPTLPGPTQPTTPTATGNLSCTPNQTLGNLSYDIKLTNINPVSGFQQVNFQLCINPSSNAGHKYLFQNFFNSDASYKDVNLVGGVPTWACYQIGPVATQLTNTNQITQVFNRSKKLGNSAIWAKTIDEFAAFMDSESAAGRINRLLQWQIKAVLRANGQVNDQFVVGTVAIHSNACVGPSPSPSPSFTPNPSAPPLACVSLTKTPSSIVLGSAATFTCQSQPDAVKYEFRYKIANGSYTSLLPDSSNIATSNLMITQAGTYTVECRACKDQSGSNCTAWGLAR